MILAGLGFSTKMQHQQTRCTIFFTFLDSATLYGYKLHNGEQLTVVKLVKERLMLVIVYLSKVLFLTSIPLIYYHKSSIKPPPPRPAYLFKAHLRGGLVETEGLFEREGLFN